ncbi:unnamed protein product, partial [Staurois parvus]
STGRVQAASGQAEIGSGNQGQANSTTRHRLQVWPSLKYTTCNQPQVMANCRSEPLVVESTRWPALVLQPTRQVSPTIIGKSIPDKHSFLTDCLIRSPCQFFRQTQS